MQWKSITILKHLENELMTLKRELKFESLGDVVAFLLDNYVSIPGRVPRDIYLKMRDKYILDFPQEFFDTAFELQGIMEPDAFAQAFEEIMQDKISKRDNFIPQGKVFECHHCGHVWRYGNAVNGLFAGRISINCPSCRYRVSKNDARSLIPLQLKRQAD
jgi:hypothetical protein